MSLGTSLIVVIAIFSSLGGILLLVLAYCCILKCRIWYRQRAKNNKINAVKPEKKKKIETNPTGEDNTLIDPKTKLVKTVEGNKEYMSDSRGIAADDEEPNDAPQKRIKIPPPKKAPPIKKQFTDTSKN